MIDTIQISNFQSHRKSHIKLKRSLNVIYGLSDSGKSAFLRAVLSNLKKEPFYLTTGASKGLVEITYDDGNIIAREYTKKRTLKCPECKVKLKDENQQVCQNCGYFLPDRPSGDKYIVNGEVKEKFGAKLPSFITDISKIYPYKFIDVEPFINVFTQHEDMFFIGKSYDGNYRNRLISALIVDSEKIDALIKVSTSNKYQNNASIKLLEKEKETIENKLDGIEELLKIVKDIIDEQSILDNEIYETETQFSTLTIIQKELNETAIVDTLLQKVQKYSIFTPKMQQQLLKLISLSEKIDKLKSIKHSIEAIEITNITIPEKYDYDFNELTTIVNQIKLLNSLYNDIKRVNIDINNTKQALNKLNTEYNDCRTEFEQYLESDDTICPITKEHFEKACLQKIMEA